MGARRKEKTYIVCCDCEQCESETGSYTSLGCHVSTKQQALKAAKEWGGLEPHTSCYVAKVITEPIISRPKPSKRKVA